MGIILCNTKHLQFHVNNKKKTIGAQFSKSYIPLCLFFICGVVASVRVAQKNPRCDGSVVIFDACWLNVFLQKLARVLLSLISKNMARPLLIFNVTFVSGYYKSFTSVQSKKTSIIL